MSIYGVCHVVLKNYVPLFKCRQRRTHWLRQWLLAMMLEICQIDPLLSAARRWLRRNIPAVVAGF
ncbi:MAG: hypothetical protein QXR18_07000 [Pyrobaculum sp.]